jgi:hypothetical protein
VRATCIVGLWLLYGCAPAETSAPPAATVPPATPASNATAVTQATPGPSPAASGGSETPPQPASRPLDLANHCPKETRFYYGDDPADRKGQFATVASGATAAVPRGADGTVVVWVVGDRDLGLASVHVTRRMKHVRLDTACMHLDAD